MDHSHHQMHDMAEMKESNHSPMDHSKMSHLDHESAMTDPQMAEFMEKDMRSRFLWSLLLTIPTLILSYFPISLPFSKNYLLFLLVTPIVFKFGSIFPVGAYQALRQKTLNMMVLIATGVLAAYFFSVAITLVVTVSSGALAQEETFYEAAAMLVTFVLFGHWMEMKSRRGTSESLRALFDLVPPQARVFRNQKELSIPTSEVLIGDIVILKPGDKVPVDGQVIDGESSIDESLVTGESIPVAKKVGDLVIGGSINQAGSLRFKATKVGADTALAQIVKLVETAQNSKAPGQRIADSAAQYLVILAVGSGIITFVVWYFIFGQTLLFALTFAISAVVIACPDALGLATPTAVAVGTGLGAKHNILIKDASTLETLSKINTLVMDKTGTITEGKPTVTEFKNLSSLSDKEIYSLVHALESRSSHPLAQAIINFVKNPSALKLSNFKNLPGQGVEATINNKKYFLGKTPDYQIALVQNQTTLAYFLVADPLKPTSALAVKKLQELNIEVFMITGDNQKTAETVGQQVNINHDHIFAEVLPEKKADYVKKLQDQGKFVAMVGDGVNDAPALAQADIGIAIGAGTDVAIETANVVLMKSDPVDILRAIRLSKATVRKMKQNLIWASVYNILAIPVAAGIFYPQFTIRPEISALLMSVSSIIVAVNAVLLKRSEQSIVSV